MTTTETVTRFDEMRMVTCPGCSTGLDARHWDDLGEDYDEEVYHCDCGVSFEVRRVGETMEVEVRSVS